MLGAEARLSAVRSACPSIKCARGAGPIKCVCLLKRVPPEDVTGSTILCAHPLGATDAKRAAKRAPRWSGRRRSAGRALAPSRCPSIAISVVRYVKTCSRRPRDASAGSAHCSTSVSHRSTSSEMLGRRAPSADMRRPPAPRGCLPPFERPTRPARHKITCSGTAVRPEMRKIPSFIGGGSQQASQRVIGSAGLTPCTKNIHSLITFDPRMRHRLFSDQN